MFRELREVAVGVRAGQGRDAGCEGISALISRPVFSNGLFCIANSVIVWRCKFATELWWLSLAIVETRRSIARRTEDKQQQKGEGMATITVSPTHFEDYSGTQFERLVFAYHVRAGWRDLIWHGQSGGDRGRDISGIEPFDDQPARKTIIQCANRGTLTLAKAKGDMSKAVKATGGTPDVFKFVSRGAVSDAGRTRIEQAAASLGVVHVTESAPATSDCLRAHFAF